MEVRMAKYMVRWDLPHASRNEVIKRIPTIAMKAPEGLKELGRWHSASFNAGYCVVETDDPKYITNWIMNWCDLQSFSVEPVITNEEVTELLQKHGLIG
jgi:hypothetical protein